MPEIVDAAPPAAAAAPDTAPVEDLGDPFKDYGGLEDAQPQTPEGGDKPPTPPDDDKPPTPAKPPVKPATGAEKPPKEAAKEKPADTQQKPQETAPEKMAPKELREAYKTSKAQIAKLEKELSEVRAKPAVPGDVEETKKQIAAAQEQLESIRKRNEELENEMRFVDYEKSAEFQDKFYKPYVNTWKSAVAEVGELNAVNPDGTTREATAEDLQAVVSISRGGDALRKATELFGDAATAAYVMKLRADIIGSHNAMQQAKEQFRTQGAEYFKQQQAERQKRFAEDAGTFKKLAQEAIDQYPQWFKAAEDDPTGKELLQKGFERADLAFTNNLPPDQRLKLHAAIRNKAGAFDYLVHRAKTMTAKIAELEKELNAYKNSEPAGGDVREHDAGGDDMGDPFKKFER